MNPLKPTTEIIKANIVAQVETARSVLTMLMALGESDLARGAKTNTAEILDTYIEVVEHLGTMRPNQKLDTLEAFHYAVLEIGKNLEHVKTNLVGVAMPEGELARIGETIEQIHAAVSEIRVGSKHVLEMDNNGSQLRLAN